MKTLTLPLILAFVLFGCTQSRNNSNISGGESADQIRTLNIEKITHNLSSSIKTISRPAIQNTLSDIYSVQEFQPIWSNGDTLNAAGQKWVEILAESKGYGLIRNYHGELMSDLNDSLKNIALGDQSRSEILFQIEFLLSQNGIQFMADLRYGYTNIDSGKIVNNFDSLTPKDISLFFNSAQNNNVDSIVYNHCIPQHPAAKELVEGLKRFIKETELSDHYDYMIPNYKSDSATAYRVAHQALQDHGYITDEDLAQADSAFWFALADYQRLNGLKGDYKIGYYTRAALNTSNYERFLMAAMTLERWKKFDLEGESNYIFVNVPGYRLTFYKDNKATVQHRVVVGAPDTHTPSFRAKLKYLNVNPQWHVPYSISSKEILPYLKKDSSYLVNRGYKLYNMDHELVDERTVDWTGVSQNNFNYRIVQNSGNYNSLGILAFMFPNEHAVFIHDTPSKVFFNSDVRAFSHGCVRLENPVDLAGVVLENDNNRYTIDTVKTMISRRGEERIYLNTPLSVIISYFTVQAENGQLVFYRDIYDRDKKMRGVLREFISTDSDHAQTL